MGKLRAKGLDDDIDVGVDRSRQIDHAHAALTQHPVDAIFPIDDASYRQCAVLIRGGFLCVPGRTSGRALRLVLAALRLRLANICLQATIGAERGIVAK